jgi:hypothetical protein
LVPVSENTSFKALGVQFPPDPPSETRTGNEIMRADMFSHRQPLVPPDEACFDVIERAAPDAARTEAVRSALWRSGRYVRIKRQLNSRELVRYGLANVRGT